MGRFGVAGWVVVATCAALVGCPGELVDPARFTACPDVPKLVFAKDCLGSGCHGKGDPSVGLDLESPDVASRLVGKKTIGGLALLIDPQAPESSAIYTKLTGAPFGSRMPLNKPQLQPETQQCVLDWIKTFSSKAKDGSADAVSEAFVPPTDASDSSAPGRDLTTDTTKFGLGGTSKCGTANVQLCEDFETGTLDTKTWTVVGTAPTIDGAQVARGQKALHILQNGNGASYIRESKTFNGAPAKYFGRAFVHFATLAGPPMNYAHWTFIAASGNKVAGEIRLSGQYQNGKNLFGVGTDNGSVGGTGDWTTSDNDPKNNPAAVPTNQWLCIEWMHDSIANETRFYWDAVEHPSLHTTKTINGGNGNPYILPDFTNVWLGWQEYQTSNIAFEMWLDEVAIDPARIGCVL